MKAKGEANSRDHNVFIPINPKNMNTRKVILAICVMVTAIAAGLVTSKHAVLLKAHAAARNVAIPYTAIQEEIWVGPHGEARGHDSHIAARKGDATLLVISGKISVLHYGQENRVVEFTHEDNNIMTTGNGQAKVVIENEDCVRVPSNAERVGEDTILGHPSTHVKFTFSGITTDRWHAKDLGCLLLQEVNTFEDGSREIRKITSLTLGAPDEKLFQLPSNPHEVPPSEFFATFHDPANAKFKDHQQADAGMEARYWRDKALRGE